MKGRRTKWPWTLITQIAFGGAAGACLALAAFPVQAQTLEEALAAAYRNNPRLLAQRAKVRATDEQVPQALGNWKPTVQVTAEAGASRVKSNVNTPTQQHREPKSATVEVVQPLFRGGRTLAQTSAAEHAVLAERARLASLEQTILFDASTAYIDVYRDRATLELNTNNEQVLRRQLEAARDRFQVGEITRTDVFQAEARLARSTADRIQAIANVEASSAAYRNNVGEPPPGRLALPKAPPDLPDTREAAQQLAATRNPNVIAAEFDQRSSYDQIDAVWGELLPTLNFEASWGKSFDATNDSSRADTTEAKLSLTVPIYQQGTTYSRLRAARQTAAERRNLIDKERRDAVQTATRAFENLVAARSRVDSYETQIRAATVALEGVEREAAVGSRTVLDVLDAEQELLDARVNLVRAQRDELAAAYELKAAIGGMSAQALRLGVDAYDPTRHYREVRDKWFGGRSSGGID